MLSETGSIMYFISSLTEMTGVMAPKGPGAAAAAGGLSAEPRLEHCVANTLATNNSPVMVTSFRYSTLSTPGKTWAPEVYPQRVAVSRFVCVEFSVALRLSCCLGAHE